MAKRGNPVMRPHENKESASKEKKEESKMPFMKSKKKGCK